MKKTHIVLLVLIAGAIAALVGFLRVTTTYETIESAMRMPGKSVTVSAKFDLSQKPVSDDLKNSNYTEFGVFDTLSGKRMKVVYHDKLPKDADKSENMVLQGKFVKDHFECSNITMKCPSKYKDDMKAAEKNIQTTTHSAPAENNSEAPKY